ncbi:MAG: ABC transporter ATP-binding protein/permease [Planctomycetaceae bacterium]|nr:ABC transporter ATP-binding protein/permease [Planctomycetaceae bacterium]
MSKKNNFLRFLGYVRPYSRYLLLAVIGGIVKFTVPLLVPQVTRHLLDNVFLNAALSQAEKLNQLLLWAGGLIAVFVFVFAPWVYIRHYFADKASHRAVFHLRYTLYYHILRMSASFFTRNRSGQIVSRLISDVALAQNLVGSALTNTWMDAAALLVVLFFLFRIDPPTALLALATFPVYLYFFRKFSVEIKSTTKRIQEELAAMAGTMNEKIAGNTVVRAFTGEKVESRKFHRQSEQLFTTSMKRILIQSANQAITATLTNIAPLAVVLFGGYRVIYGHLTVGGLMAVIMYLAPLYLPLQRFSELNIVLANAMAALDRIFEIMDEVPEITDRPGAADLPCPSGKVEFDKVSFHYTRGCPVIEDINFCAAPGKRIALVGPSGSGKTTIVSLIPRFYDVASGSIRIDGMDVRDITMQSLRRHIGMVLQDPILFSGTIRENVLYGLPNASDEQVEAACRAANAYEFILSLPQGFDTEVGERGRQLSGGQKQRLTLARAFLKDPRILILDEATSSLDTESERMIQDAMQRLMAGRTTFIIAHRLSTVTHADNILVLQNGRIAEQGTHDELMHAAGLYSRFYRRQLELSRSNNLLAIPFQ